MRQRRITAEQVFSCLELGVITEGPSLDIKGHWRCTMRRLAADEKIGVVVAIDPVSRILIVTVLS